MDSILNISLILMVTILNKRLTNKQISVKYLIYKNY